LFYKINCFRCTIAFNLNLNFKPLKFSAGFELQTAKKINIKKILLLIVLAVSIQNLFAYKLVKNRDHWGIWGGYSKIEDIIDGHTTNAGQFIIDKVTLNCTGNGNDKCQYDGHMVQTDDGIFETAGIQIINNLFKRAEEIVEGGTPNGSFNENYAILQSNGTYKIFNYSVTWNSSEPSKVELNIIEITN
jgi:hypothetical protein